MKLNEFLLITALSLLAATGLMAKQQANEKIPGVVAQPASYFYTGKPYDADLGAYTFNYRNYDPELNRWTSADPSGFPDGANYFLYTNNAPLLTFDLQGMDRQWIYGSYQMTASWMEYPVFTMGGNPSFSLGFPWQVGISISPGWEWQKQGSITTNQTWGTQPTEASAPVGWTWVPETITVYNHVADANPSYITIRDQNIFGGWTDRDRLGTLNVTFSWKRLAEE